MTHTKIAEVLMDDTTTGTDSSRTLLQSPNGGPAAETPLAMADRLRHKPGADLWTSLGPNSAFTGWASLFQVACSACFSSMQDCKWAW